MTVTFRLLVPLLFAPILLSSCGGGGGGSSGSSSIGSISTTAPSGPIVLAAGSVYVMPAAATVLVPSGTTVTATNGTVITVNGTNDTVSTQAGSIVTVPASATGAANDAVTTGPPSSGALSTSSLTVTLIAGSASTNLTPTDGTGAAAILWGGGHLAVDAAGDIYFSDRGALREATQAGVVTTLTPNTVADFEGIALDATQDVFASGNQIGPGSSFNASVVERLSGGAVQTLYPNWEGAPAAPFDGLGGLALNGAGILYLADAGSNNIVQFSAATGATVLAGNGVAGDADGTGSGASLTLSGSDLAIDATGNLYTVANGSIREITGAGVVSTPFSGLSTSGGAIAIDQSGNFYVAGFQTITRIGVSGTITKFPFTNSIDFITSMACDSSGNLYVGTRGGGAQIFKVSF